MKVLGVPLADTASDYYRIVEPLRALTWSTDVEAMIVPLADPDSETPVRVVRVGTPGDDELKAAAAEVFPDDAALQAAWIQYQLAVPDAATCDMVAMTRRYERTALALIYKLQAAGVRVVYDMDDDPWSVPPENPAYASWGPNGRQVLAWFDYLKKPTPFSPRTPKAAAEYTAAMRAGLVACARAADALTVTTPRLVQVFQRFNKHIYLLPNQMKLNDWLMVQPMDHPGELWFGWAGSKTHLGDVAWLEPAVVDVLKAVPDAKFVIIGFPELLASMPKIPRDRVIVFDRQPLDKYRPLLASLDVVWAPSAPIAFNHAKSDIRVLEAFMCMRPVVASETTYGDTTRTSHGGLVARTVREWATHTIKLLTDEALRTMMGKDGANYTGEHRTYETQYGLWRAAYEDIMLRPTKTPPASEAAWHAAIAAAPMTDLRGNAVLPARR